MWTEKLLLILFSCTLSAYCLESYVVMVPRVVRPGGTCYIHITSTASGSLDMIVEMQQNNVSRPILNYNYTGASPETSRIALKVPDNLNPGAAKLKISVTGAITNSSETDVLVRVKRSSIFIQTDKSFYKPSQTIRFRAVVTRQNLLPYNGSCNISISDSQGNKINLWHNVKLTHGVVSKKLGLSDQPVLGDWVIEVTNDEGESKKKKITIEKYVLPKFEVDVVLPPFMLVGSRSMKITANVTYTFGKGVNGIGSIRVKKKLSYPRYDWQTGGYIDAASLEFKNIPVSNGKTELDLDSNHLRDLAQSWDGFRSGETIVAEVNVTETLTGITQAGHSQVTFYKAAEQISFTKSTPSAFKPGLPYSGSLKVSQVDGSPVINPKNISLSISYGRISNRSHDKSWRNPYYHYNYQDVDIAVSEQGIAEFQLHPGADVKTISIVAHYGSNKDIQRSKYLKMVETEFETYLQIHWSDKNIMVGEEAEFQVTSNKNISSIYSLVMSRGIILHSVNVNSSKKFSVKITESMTPTITVVVYGINDENELVLDSLDFDVKTALKNPVDLSFDINATRPGGVVNLTVNAPNQSFVGILAVDQSALLMGGDNDIRQHDIITELSNYDSSTGDFHADYWWYERDTEVDTYAFLKNIGLSALTNALVFKVPRRGSGFIAANRLGPIPPAPAPIPPHRQNLFPISSPSPPPPNPGSTPLTKIPTTRVRKAFPETWLWTNATAGNTGACITAKVPDTITTWVASAFTISSSVGLSVAAQAAKLRVSKPFFVSLNLPYSVVRGEEMALQVIVFNYMSDDLIVKVTLPESPAYRSVSSASGSIAYKQETRTAKVKVASEKGATVTFPIVPTAIGVVRIKVIADASPVATDAIQKDLLVQAEGVSMSYNQPVLIDLKNSVTSKFTEVLSIDFPKHVISGSKRIDFSLIGDILGSSINGLENLIRMPYGCGEQNMLNFAPTIFVTDYLQKTNQLSAATKHKSLHFMEIGYQRELTYQRRDGSFSAFGQNDDSGSTWLTAFVIKSLEKAKKFIYIDEGVVRKALQWIIQRQNKDGSFSEPGRIIHKQMMGGGTRSNLTLAAYVLSALSECDLEMENLTLAISKAVRYIKHNIPQYEQPYSLALSAYALYKSGEKDISNLLSKLDELSHNKGGMQFWEIKPDKSNEKDDINLIWRPPHKQNKASDIELTAYVILVKTRYSGVVSSLPAVRWLTTQRNGDGGFSSTQDTVVSLESLSNFAKLVYGNTDMRVAVETADKVIKFEVNKKNQIVLQNHKLTSDLSSVKIRAEGKGIALAQVLVTYNIDDSSVDAPFKTTAVLTSEEKNSITVEVCTRWLLMEPSGMVVAEIGIPSGFSPDVQAIDTKAYEGLKRVEQEDRKLILYFEEITSKKSCIEVKAERTHLTARIKPTAVRVYDYYEPSNQQTIFYASKKLNNMSICQACDSCCPN